MSNSNISISEFLKISFKVIDTEETWTKDAFARDAQGFSVRAQDEGACKFCSLGALRLARHSLKGEGISEVYSKAKIRLSKTMGRPIELFNDRESYDKVVEAWKDAIFHAVAEENAAIA